MGLGDETYVVMTTYKKAGDAVAAPVWIVDLADGSLGFWTSSGSGKAKRLAHTSRILLQPSDARGRLKEGTSPTEATARLVAAGDPLFDEVSQKVKAKYGFMTVSRRASAPSAAS